MRVDSRIVARLREKNRALAERLRTEPHAGGGLMDQARAIGAPLLLAESLVTEAVRQYLQGDIQASVKHNREARELLESLPFEQSDPFFLWLTSTIDGLTSEAQGQATDARRSFESAASIARSAHLIELAARSLMSLGFMANRELDPVTALGYFLQLLRLPEVDESTRAVTYMYLAGLFEDQKQWGAALLYVGEGLTSASGIAPDVEGAMRGLYAELLARTGELAGAEEALELAGQITVPDTIHAAKLDESRSRYFFESGNLEQSELCALSANSLLASQGAPSHLGKSCGLLCEVYLEKGQPQKVLDVLGGTDTSVLPARHAGDLLLFEIQAHRQLGQLEEASISHDKFAEFSSESRLDIQAFYRLHRQLVDARSLEAQHEILVSRQVELARLQVDLFELVDQVANDLNSPLTTLQLVFDTLQLDRQESVVAHRLPLASAAIERMSQLAEQFMAAQEDD